MSGTAERIDDFIAATRQLSDEAAFVAAFPHPFLVHEATARTAPLEPTPDRRTTRIPSKAAPPIGDGFAREDVWIFRVCPRDPERDHGDVTLGRDEACDIVVADPTVSLVHARFSLEAGIGDEGGAVDERLFYVADAGSSNGTFVDGAATAKDEPVPLDDQTSLRFGSQAKFQFFTAAGFFQFLDFFRRIKKRDT